MQAKLTPPAIAKSYGVSTDKVLRWIRTGELRAVNIATKRTGRPRWAIDPADLADFERSRAAVPQRGRAAPRARRADVMEFLV